MLTNILDAQDSPTLENCSRPKGCFLHVLRSRRDELCPSPQLWVTRSTSHQFFLLTITGLQEVQPLPQLQTLLGAAHPPQLLLLSHLEQEAH